MGQRKHAYEIVMAILNSKKAKVILRYNIAEDKISSEGKEFLHPYRFIKKDAFHEGLMFLGVFQSMESMTARLVSFGLNGPDSDDPDFFFMRGDLFADASIPPSYTGYSIPDWAGQIAVYRLATGLEGLWPTVSTRYAWTIKGTKPRSVLHTFSRMVFRKGFDVDWYPFIGKQGEGRLIVKLGYISKTEARAIVLPANLDLMPAGGVSGVIHHSAGPKLATYCKEISRFKILNAICTPAFSMETQRQFALRDHIDKPETYPNPVLENKLNLIHLITPNTLSPEVLEQLIGAIFREARQNALYSLAIPSSLFDHIDNSNCYFLENGLAMIRKYQAGIDVEIWCHDPETHEIFGKVNNLLQN